MKTNYKIGLSLLILLFIWILIIILNKNNSSNETYTWLNLSTQIDHSKMDHSNMNIETMDHSVMISWEESFLKLMIPHHQEAIDTSKIILSKTENLEIKNLLSNIINAQEKEVDIMNNLANDFYKNENVFEYDNMMDENLEKYDTKKAEKIYLEWMIIHHKWAIQMAKKMIEYEMKPETKIIVDNIISSQQSEIDFMNELLKNY